MATHAYRTGGHDFEVDVYAIDTASDPPVALYAARITELDGGERTPIRGKGQRAREIYGPTEAWAFRNVCALLDHGDWCEVDELKH
jgi:hypothetical protein